MLSTARKLACYHIQSHIVKVPVRMYCAVRCNRLIIACVALRFWSGAQTIQGGGSETARTWSFLSAFADSPLSSAAPNKTAMLRHRLD